MKLTVRARLVQYALALGVDPVSAVDDTLARDFAAMCARARWKRAS